MSELLEEAERLKREHDEMKKRVDALSEKWLYDDHD